MIILGQRIRALRKQNNVKQYELADYLKVDPTTVNKYESGEREPEIAVLIKIADYFDVSLDYLVGRADYKI